MSFTEPLFQHISMNVEDAVNQTTSVKTVSSLKLTNQLRLKKLNLNLTISSSVKILRHDIPAAMMMIVSQKIT